MGASLTPKVRTTRARASGAQGRSPGAVASADADHDGVDNWGEYVSGCDPTNPLSYFSVTSFNTPSTGSISFVVTWNSVSGRVYGVDWSENLSQSFTNISGDLPYPANSYTDNVDRAGSQQFYRIDVRLAP